LLSAVTTSAQLPEGIATKSVEIWSDGTRLAGDLFWPKTWTEGERLPAIVLCHGWGGTKGRLNEWYAPVFAAEGFFVLTFDYRGWGESDGRLVVRGEMPEPDDNGEVTVRAQAIRRLVSPVERIEDIQAAISWLELEPGVDRHRIGLWGTSFGGGNVVAVAAIDKRVKCVCSQVGDVNTRNGWMSIMRAVVEKYPQASGSAAELELLYEGAVRRLSATVSKVEDLVRAEKIAEDMFANPFDPAGLLVVAEAGADDAEIEALVEAVNTDRKIVYSILAGDPERAEEIILIRRVQRARGLIDPFPQGIGFGTLPPLRGIAHASQMVVYSAADLADRIACPVQIIEAGKEELMDIEQLGGLLFKRLKGRVPVERHVFHEISHFEVYRPPARGRAIELQIGWFNRHLKGEAPGEPSHR
jgi:dienelactone hydrolase